MTDKTELMVMYYGVKELESFVETLNSILSDLDSVVDDFEFDDDMEYDTYLDSKDSATLKHMIRETNSLLAKYNARIRQLDRKIGLAFGFTDEELDKMDKFVDGVVGATIGGMVATILLDDDKEGTDE